MSSIKTGSFFASSLTRENKFQNFKTFKAWLAERCRPEEFRVEQVPLDEMEKWALEPDGSRISHESGRFFHIEGLHVKTNFGKEHEWDQPIINQPEIKQSQFATQPAVIRSQLLIGIIRPVLVDDIAHKTVVGGRLDAEAPAVPYAPKPNECLS